MKSTILKKKDYIPVKKYLGLFLVLFVVVVLFMINHYYEEPLSVEGLQTRSQFDREKAEQGYFAPEFKIRNLQGNLDGLSNYRGQVVLVNLWATWCGPCRVEMPGLENLYRRFRSEGFIILAVSLDKGNDQEVKKFVDEYRLSFPVLIDSEKEVENLYPTFTIPSTFVIDKKGRVVTKVDGAKNWESEETFKAIEYLLKG